MRRTIVRMRWLAAALLAAAGCQTPTWWHHPDWFRRADKDIKPPLHEEYILAPSDDPRFNAPPTYPKEALDAGAPKKDPGRPGEFPQRGPMGFGAGPGMGGGY
jgi:hypothetical protein